jgi:uncharacterized protein YqjF (DUF2071 family)
VSQYLPEKHIRLPVVGQSWRRIAFLHWPFPVDAIASLLPDELEPDVMEGQAWVTITPFEVRRFRMLGLPPLPGLSDFPETNLRTYVRDRTGVDGLWFLSIDVGNVLNVFGGRLLGLPYFRSEMSVEGVDVIRYRCRRGAARAMHDIVIEPRGALVPDLLTEHLTGRWRAFTRVAGQLLVVPVEHEPWPLRSAGVVSLEETLFANAGLTAPMPPALVHYSDGVDAVLASPRRP